MRTLLKYSALVAAAVVLLPFDGFAQGRGQGSGGDQARAQERAQVERGQTDRDRDRIRDQDRTHQPDTAPAYEGMKSQQQVQAQQQVQTQQREQAQAQQQIHQPGTGNGPDSDIYGHELMTVQERNQYREQLRLVESDPEKKTRFLAQHREQMQNRARAEGVVIDDGEKEEAE
jgi:hypothetical protein